MTGTQISTLTDYFTDCWLYSMADRYTPDCAFFKVNRVDRDAFPELQHVFALKVDAVGALALYPDGRSYMAAVTQEAGR